MKHPKALLYFSVWMRWMGLLITEDGIEARSPGPLGRAPTKGTPCFCWSTVAFVGFCSISCTILVMSKGLEEDRPPRGEKSRVLGKMEMEPKPLPSFWGSHSLLDSGWVLLGTTAFTFWGDNPPHYTSTNS